MKKVALFSVAIFWSFIFSGTTPCYSEAIVNVKVVDRSMPVFDKQFYSMSVPENVELQSPLGVPLQASSPLGRKLIYTIVEGNELEEFALDFNTGMIFLKSSHFLYLFWNMEQILNRLKIFDVLSLLLKLSMFYYL